MSFNLYTTPHIKLNHDETSNILTMTWLKNTGSEEYRNHFKNSYEISKIHNCKKWLLDQRLKDGITLIQDAEWLNNIFVPTFIELMTKDIKVSIVISNNFFAEFSSKRTINKLLFDEDKNKAIDTKFHTSMEEGYTWLNSFN